MQFFLDIITAFENELNTTNNLPNDEEFPIAKTCESIQEGNGVFSEIFSQVTVYVIF